MENYLEINQKSYDILAKEYELRGEAQKKMNLGLVKAENIYCQCWKKQILKILAYWRLVQGRDKHYSILVCVDATQLELSFPIKWIK